jgi:precorrin-3B C17-methyltransferase
VAAFASIDVKGDEPALVQVAREYRCALRLHSAEELAAVPGGFSRSDFVERTVGVDNVCERAACAAGERLVAGKRAGDGVTVAIAALAGGGGRSVSFGYGPEGAIPVRSGHPACGVGRAGGSLSVVGIGPGGGRDMTLRAHDALCACDLIVGYPVYVNLIRDDFPDKEVFTTPMRKEAQRCRAALEHAAAGRKVALVCSGDPGVYGMAGLVLELAPAYGNVPVEVVPGVSAGNDGAALVGAPLMHDHCLISLSDALTPWSYIERRLEAAAQAGFCIVLYNPASRTRPGHLRRACGILLRHLPAETVCATVANIGRAGQESRVLSWHELADARVDMFTTVFVGNGETRVVAGRMITPRGYRMEGR